MDTTLSEASAAQVIEQLLNQIKRLEAGLLEERNLGEKQKYVHVGEVARTLRLHQVYLVHAGSTSIEDVRQRLAGDPGALAALDSVFELDRAPLPKPNVTANAKLELLAIRYLGWIGEALMLSCATGSPDADAVRTAGKCCDRIEHIAQYALDVDDWTNRAEGLIGDVQFMRAALTFHASALEAGLPSYLPTQAQLDDLLGGIASSASIPV